MNYEKTFKYDAAERVRSNDPNALKQYAVTIAIILDDDKDYHHEYVSIVDECSVNIQFESLDKIDQIGIEAQAERIAYDNVLNAANHWLENEGEARAQAAMDREDGNEN